jgi:hypothetical protein
MNFTIMFFVLLGMIIWIFPAVRQFRTKYFLFFLMFGLGDLGGLAYTKYIDPDSNLIFYIVVTVTALFSILPDRYSLKNILLYAVVVSFFGGLYLLYPDLITGSIILAAVHLAIIVVLLRDLVNDFFIVKIFSIFLAVMIFYELTTLTKIASLLTGFTNNYIYFGMTTTTQILIGLFFSIFRYDHKRFILQLK